MNVWGKHPFFFEPEGEHSAQSGALGAALTGGQFISNASSSQGILYAMESHYVTVGKKIGGFVLQVAARVVSKHSLNVMAGHDDVYALLSAGYTILFGSNPQEAADLAAISYRDLRAVADPGGQRHGRLLHQPHAQRGAAARARAAARVPRRPGRPDPGPDRRPGDALRRQGPRLPADAVPRPPRRRLPAGGPRRAARPPRRHADQSRSDNAGDAGRRARCAWVPEELQGQWRRQWLNALEKGTRQLVPGARRRQQPRPDRPGAEPARLPGRRGRPPHPLRQRRARAWCARRWPSTPTLTGRTYAPVHHLRLRRRRLRHGRPRLDHRRRARRAARTCAAQGLKVGVVSVKLLQPFPEAELVEALAGTKAVTVLERSDQTALTSLVTPALFRAAANADEPAPRGHPGARRRRRA